MRKKHSDQFKFKVALVAVKGEMTVPEICQAHDIAASLVHKWKKDLLDNGANVFSKNKAKNQAKEEHAKQVDQLYQKVGELTVERDFLKKSWDRYKD